MEEWSYLLFRSMLEQLVVTCANVSAEETANLIIHMLAVDPIWIHPLPLDAPTIIPNTGGVCVTLIEANHCPGSCLFLFEGQQTVDAGDSVFKSPFIGSSRIFRYLHCGDFRASPRHVLHPAVKGKHMDHIYLDTTYLDPKVCRNLYNQASKSPMSRTVHILTSATGYICLCRVGSETGGRGCRRPQRSYKPKFHNRCLGEIFDLC